MRIIEPSYQIFKKESNPLKIIETAGRICYKSEENITENSAAEFVKRLVTSKHYAMLEHASIYIKLHGSYYQQFIKAMHPNNNKYLVYNDTIPSSCPYIVSGNARAWFELLSHEIKSMGEAIAPIFIIILTALKNYLPEIFTHLPDVLLTRAMKPYFEKISGDAFFIQILSENELCEELKDYPDILKQHRRISIEFTCDRGATHELVRHRDASFAMESTRFCTYTKNRFGNEITVIKPTFYDENSAEYNLWKTSCEQDEKTYLQLIQLGRTAQEARGNLPHSLKVDLLITATEEEWQHICNLRAKGTTGAPHPQVKELMYPCYEELVAYTNGRIN